MNIVCVYKSGGDYDVRYVLALKDALEKHIQAHDYEFVCLTNEVKEVKSYGIRTIELEHDLPNWWCKIELFNPRFFYQEKDVLYFDLDVFILDNIDDFIEKCKNQYDFLMLRSSDKRGEANDWPSSSIMFWKSNIFNSVTAAVHSIYTQFFHLGETSVIENASRKPPCAGQRTDQGFIREIINPPKIQDLMGEKYILFKNQYMRHPEKLEHATILNWTGFPRWHFHKHPFHEMWIQRVVNQTKLIENES